MTKAVFNKEIIAESDKCREVEGNQYFPPDSVQQKLLKKSGNTYTCPWKGLCYYYDVTVKGKTVKDGAWSYPKPKPAAKQIAGYFAFWKDVKVKGLL